MSTSATPAQTVLFETLNGISGSSNVTEIYSDLFDGSLRMAEDEWYEREEHTKASDFWNIGVVQ